MGEPSVVTVPAAEGLRDVILRYLRYARGVTLEQATSTEVLGATACAVREALIDRGLKTQATYRRLRPKTVHYVSMEFLIGRLLANNLMATGLWDTAAEALCMLGHDLSELLEEERDPGLGNGGLGRLGACFLDSLATLDYPAWGYGLRYDYGIFRQKFVEGFQRERPDTWLKDGYSWEVPRPELAVPVLLAGRCEWILGQDGESHSIWTDWRLIYGVPHDIHVAGHGTETVSTLRLWKAEAPDEFDFEVFSHGAFLRAVATREEAEAITKVLYPADETEAGRELRLTQEYFLAACTVRDIVRRFKEDFGAEWDRFPEKVAIQLNDTHPALIVAELQRFFVDEVRLPWERAWGLVRATCGFTNHTLLPEALETWPTGLVEKLLPRHSQIIHEINRRFLSDMVPLVTDDPECLGRLSLVREEGDRRFRMANLAVVGSHRVNGVAALHTELLKKSVFRDFASLWPDHFVSITNGVTPRRWLSVCNPALAAAITERIGPGWERDLERLAALAPCADDPACQDAVLAIKRENKEKLAAVIDRLCAVTVDPDSMFDVQVKRLHEYKRQLLNVMHIIALYRRLKENPALDIAPRTFIFGAKAAPSYRQAKQIIKLINAVADVVNEDWDLGGKLKVAFLPDYGVALAEKIIPAADLSEQISTAGMEASGTGNMKLALNGALTIGTLDGANVEIGDAVGRDNIFIFGLTAQEVVALRTSGRHDPWELYRTDAELAGVLDGLHNGTFVGGDPNLLRDIWSSLMEHGDRYMVLADFRSYMDTQARVDALYRDRRAWAARSIRNIAAMARFSSDRAIKEYADKVWQLHAVPVE
jgi:glycogen phosphorylase